MPVRHFETASGYFFPSSKEVHFFDRDENYAKGAAWYSDALFGGSVEAAAIGEITPSYMYLEDIPEKIYNMLGKDVKLIFILRQPVSRTYPTI